MKIYLSLYALFAFFIFLSLCGWGLSAIDLIYKKKKDAPYSFSPIIGASVVLVIGGVLNVSKLIGTVSFSLIFLFGIVYFFLIFLKYYFTSGFSCFLPDKKSLLLLLLMLILIFPFFIDGLYAWKIHPVDDFQGYLIIPIKMLQLGYFQPDPFNARMNIAGPGSFSFLQAGVIQVLGYNSIYMFDRSVGLFLLVGTFYNLYLYKPIAIVSAISLTLFFILEISLIMGINATPTYIIFPYLFSLFILLDNKGLSNVEEAIIIGLILGALLTLKNTIVPFAVFMFLAFAIVDIANKRGIRKNIVKNTIITALIASSIVFLWYLPKLTNTVFLNIEKPSLAALLKNILLYFKQSRYFLYALILNVTLASANIYIMYKHKKKWFGGYVLLISSFLGMAVYIFISGGTSLLRYNYPMILFTSSIFTVYIFNAVKSNRNRQILLIIMLTFGFTITLTHEEKAKQLMKLIKGYPESITSLFTVSVTSSSYFDDVCTVREAQEKTESGSTILVRINKPYLLDYSRNKILVVDIPCMTSISPGMPCTGDSVAFVKYLLSNGIHYVLYSPKTIENDKDLYLNEIRIKNNLNISPLTHVYYHLKNAPSFYNILQNIGMQSNILFDSGTLRLIDILKTGTKEQDGIPQKDWRVKK